MLRRTIVTYEKAITNLLLDRESVRWFLEYRTVRER
jgi:hypothetical protein